MISVYIKVAIVAAGISGIAGIFLPFYGVFSPLNVVIDGAGTGWSLLGLPLFLVFPILAASVRSIFSARITSAELFISYVSIALGVLTVCALLVWLVADDWAFVIRYGAPVLIGAAVFVLGLRRQRFGAQVLIAATQIIYVVHCAGLWLLFYDNPDWDIGAYTVFIAAAVYAAQVGSYFLTRQPMD